MKVFVTVGPSGNSQVYEIKVHDTYHLAQDTATREDRVILIGEAEKVGGILDGLVMEEPDAS